MGRIVRSRGGRAKFGREGARLVCHGVRAIVLIVVVDGSTRGRATTHFGRTLLEKKREHYYETVSASATPSGPGCWLGVDAPYLLSYCPNYHQVRLM